jgi:hypothetical protein
MQFSNLEVETTSSNEAVIRLIEICDCSKLGSRNVGQRMQVQIVEYPIKTMYNYIEQNRAANHESARVTLKDRHDEGQVWSGG